MKHELFWSVQLDDVLVDGKSTGYCKKPGRKCRAAPDSGTSLITFPQKHFDPFNRSYGDTVSCAEGDELNFASITFVIEGKKYEVPSHHWIQRKIDTSDKKGGKCTSSIKPLGVNQDGLEDLHILGDTFMQLYYTIHDRDNNRVGFAVAKHEEDEVLVQFDTAGMLSSVKTIQKSSVAIN